MPLTAEDLAQRIRYAISDSDVTQEAVAKAIGIDPSALSKALAGHRNFSSLEIARLCETLKISPLALLDDGSPPAPASAADSVARVGRAAELDALLTQVGYPPNHERRYPATLLDRAIEAYLAGHISIRPIAGLIGVHENDLWAELEKRQAPPHPPEGGDRG